MLWLLKANARPATVLVDEFDACSFEGLSDHLRVDRRELLDPLSS
jgi:hypothetical protein